VAFHDQDLPESVHDDSEEEVIQVSNSTQTSRRRKSKNTMEIEMEQAIKNAMASGHTEKP
jgi:hypothetical protein